MDNYEVIEQIGKGSFGVIQKIKRKSDGKILVWKEINYGKMSEREQQQLVAEVSIIQELKDPNVVRFYDKIINTKETKIYIVMEFCEGGDLSALLKKRKKDKIYLSEDDVWKMFSQILLGINECHNFPKGKILHRDLKPANIFIDGTGNMKLGDFGLSRLMGDNSVFATTHVGTPYYMSPEQVLESNYDEKSDIWSAGCLLYEMCALRPPFEATNHLSLAIKIKDGKFERIPLKFSEDLQKIIEQMMHSNPEFRPSVQKLLGLRAVSVFIKENKYAEDKKFVAEKESCLKKKEELFKEQRVKAYIKEKEISALENILKELEDEVRLLQLEEELSKAKQSQITKQQMISLQQLHQLQQQQKQPQNCKNNHNNTDADSNKQTLNNFVKELMIIRNNENSNSASKNSTTASSNGTFEYLRRDKEGNTASNQIQNETVQPFQNSYEEMLSPRIPVSRQNVSQLNPTLLSQQLYLSPSSNNNTNHNNITISSYYKSNPNHFSSPTTQQYQSQQLQFQQQQQSQQSQNLANVATAIKIAQQSPFARGYFASVKQQKQQLPQNSNLIIQNNQNQVKSARPRIISEIGSENKSNQTVQSTNHKNSSIFAGKQLRTSTSIDLSSQQTNLEAKYFLPLKLEQVNSNLKPQGLIQSQVNASYDANNTIKQSQYQYPDNDLSSRQYNVITNPSNEINIYKSAHIRHSDSCDETKSKVSGNLSFKQENPVCQVLLQNIPPKSNIKQTLKTQTDDKTKPNTQYNTQALNLPPSNYTSNFKNLTMKPPKLGQQQQPIQEEPRLQVNSGTNAAYTSIFANIDPSKQSSSKVRSNNSMGAGSFAYQPFIPSQNNNCNIVTSGNVSARAHNNNNTSCGGINRGNSTERSNLEYKKEAISRPRNSSSNGSQQTQKYNNTLQVNVINQKSAYFQ